MKDWRLQNALLLIFLFSAGLETLKQPMNEVTDKNMEKSDLVFRKVNNRFPPPNAQNKPIAEEMNKLPSLFYSVHYFLARDHDALVQAGRRRAIDPDPH